MNDSKIYLHPERDRKRSVQAVVQSFVLLLGCLLPFSGHAQTLPLQIAPEKTLYNRSSERGMPLTDAEGNPIDKYGELIDTTAGTTYRAPTQQEQETAGLTTSPPTLRQFQNMVTFGFSQPKAPSSGDPPQTGRQDFKNTNGLTLESAVVGAPYVGRVVSFLFGQVIPPPDEDEFGDPLVDTDGNVIEPEDYWFLEPYVEDVEPVVDSETGEEIVSYLPYYYSPHASQVFATETGSITITWRRRLPVSESDRDDDLNYLEEDGSYYVLSDKTYIVSGGAVKTPQKIYWNVGDNYQGPDVTIDQGRVGALNVVYSNSFPEFVDESEAETISTATSGNEQVETRTLWVDSVSGIRQVKALNKEGRIFVELLGDFQNDGVTRVHLGFELVDVTKVVTPQDIVIDLGYPVLSGLDEEPEGGLFPKPVNSLSSLDFMYRQVFEDVEIPILWAVSLTDDINDVLIHWLAEGEESIRWPYHYSRYQFVWPDDISEYSHYVRPSSSSKADALLSAISIPREMVPVIEEQDVIGGSDTGAFFDETVGFYTVLTEDSPAHRTLLRYSSGEEVAFDRVLSWRQEELGSLARTSVYPTLVAQFQDGTDDFVNLQGAASVVLEDNYAYVVAQDDSSLTIIDLSDPANPVLLKTIKDGETSGFDLMGGASHVVVQDGIAYVSSPDDDTVNIINVSNPETEDPYLMASLTFGVDSYNYLQFPYILSVDGDLLVISNRRNTADSSVGALTFVDISDPNNPKKLYELEHNDLLGTVASDGVNTSSVLLNWRPSPLLVGDYLYVGSNTGDAVTIIDVNPLYESDIENSSIISIEPQIVSILSQDDGFAGLDGVTSMEISDNNSLLVVGSFEKGLSIFNVADPSNPYLVSEIPVGSGDFNLLDYVTQIDISGDIAVAVSENDNGVTFIDLSIPASPVLFGEFQHNAGEAQSLENAASVAMNGTIAVVASSGSEGGVSVFNVPDLNEYYYAGGEFSDSVATELSSYNDADQTFAWSDELSIPRVVYETVYVGDRIVAPDDELGAGDDESYLAGFIYEPVGTSFNPNAYSNPLDPLVGFDEASMGSIIPVNSRQDQGELQVWWFRENGADTAKEFKTVLWPSVIGHYSIEWPEDGKEIVLASNDGSGGLSSLPASGNIYYINDENAIGYNPNEEHALMSGGQAYALRDDLNVVDVDSSSYTSRPYVLLEYEGEDGRPSIMAFKVLREKPEEGLTFKFLVEAGTILQPPMPLPLFDLPLKDALSETPRSLNTEITSSLVDVMTYAADQEIFITTTASHSLAPFNDMVIRNPADTSQTENFYIVDTNYPNELTGYVIEGHFDITVVEPNPFLWEDQENILELHNNESDNDFSVTAGQEIVLINTAATSASEDELPRTVMRATVIGSNGDILEIRVDDTSLYTEYEDTVYYANRNTTVNRIEYSEDILGAHKLLIQSSTLVNSDSEDPILLADGTLNDWQILNAVSISETNDGVSTDSNIYGAFTLQDRKGNIWVYRGQHGEGLTLDPDQEFDTAPDGEAFQMQFYYEPLDSFYYPSRGNVAHEADTITPYLRAINSADGTYEGEAVAGTDQAFPITYIPIWPEDAPELHLGETLTLPKRELPDIRGNSSLQIIYDQGLANSELVYRIAVLHDPTREKEFYLDEIEFPALPASLETSEYLGDYFFPNLPPHLSDRFFFDPNRGEYGALVFKGVFMEETVGEDYLMLNVLTAEDQAELNDLVSTTDPDYDLWTNAIAGLSADLELFQEDSEITGTYVAVDNVPFGPNELIEILDDDEAVDSYALSAVGPKTGHVSLIAGNGLAFTDEDDPVSILIVKVVKTLHPGELKVVQSTNPLSEKLTMQQVVDLAGASVSGYDFEWKIGAPIDGEAPAYKEFVAVDPPIVSSAVWNHVRFPLSSDSPDNLSEVASSRLDASALIGSEIVVLESIEYSGADENADDNSAYDIEVDNAHYLTEDVELALEDSDGRRVNYRVSAVDDSLNFVMAAVDDEGSVPDSFTFNLDVSDAERNFLVEELVESGPQSYLFSDFTTPVGPVYSELWLSLDLASDLGARVFINGQEVVLQNMEVFVDPGSAYGASYADTLKGAPSTSYFDALTSAYLLDLSVLELGQATVDDETSLTHQLVVELYPYDSVNPGEAQTFDLKLEALEYQDLVTDNELWLDMDHDNLRAVIGGTADVQALSDNYITMRYGAIPEGSTVVSDWSEWVEPQLAEGWIKRVLDGINPFEQRTTDLFNNAIETDASMLTIAGPRWEGNVALNSDTINDYGLIEIYETVLNRGRNLSIDAGINYGPANDALLLVAGYINDLYMFLGNEAYADALNPTIGISTADGALGDVATSLFAFQGQVGSLLDEELAMLRGRDDFLPPGVEANPVYNRLFWNYTRGIDSGEIIYALNYNIQEDQDDSVDGIIDAEDAAIMYPQGHGDAYGHYMTALKGYFSLLLDEDFDWVPRTESVLILGQTVQVDYRDERKFAAAASSLANAGNQTTKLTWRKAYEAGEDKGWEHFGNDAIRENSSQGTTRNWGVDHWATRTGQGAFLNWVVGNSMLEEVDSDESHEGIQVVDRQTVPELKEIADLGRELQTTMDTAESKLNPLGLSEGSIPFDIQPVSSGSSETHYEQIYNRALSALENAVTAFDDAKDVTGLMRSEEISLADLQTSVDSQELAFQNSLIEIYGTPYADDIGVGKTFVTDYDGPDLVHYMYVDTEELSIPGWIEPESDKVYNVDAQASPFSGEYQDLVKADNAILDNLYEGAVGTADDTRILDSTHEHYVEYTLGSHGFFGRPGDWSGSRESPGQIQSAISGIILAVNDLRQALEDHSALKYQFDRMLELFEASVITHGDIREVNLRLNQASSIYESAKLFFKIASKIQEKKVEISDAGIEALNAGVPMSTIFGLANGGDLLSGVRGTFGGANVLQKTAFSAFEIFKFSAESLADRAFAEAQTWTPFYDIAPKEWQENQRQGLYDLDMALGDVQMSIFSINAKVQALTSARSKYKALLAKGNRIQAEREVFRQRSAALVQGYRTRDAAFRVFRDEKLERYNALFDLAAQYSFLAAQAFDYETGLLHTDEGKEFVERIVASRALGVVADGQPQFAGSNNGDPGLSSVLAEMDADWQVLRGRLGHNNPDTDVTTVSLRTENYRILPVSDGDTEWEDVLYAGMTDNLLADEDVVRHCMQINNGNGFPVPGIILEFSTTIQDGYNLFGQQLAGGDHAFSPTTYATKIFSVGVALEGYKGIDDTTANGAVTGDSSTADPDAFFLDPDYLSATPYVYLIPVGLDSMRSPPLGDQSTIRTWSVEDVTIPLPFNIGASDFSTKKLYQSSDSLTEDLFSIRKHQAFRAVGSADSFPDSGRFFSTIFTNSRLVGRSVWNSRWKLVIPGRTLHYNPEQGLDVFIKTVKDIKLNFETLSYSGN